MHMASAPDNSSLLIDNFIDLIWLEKGLSTNTLSAYRQDLTSFNKWLGETSIKSATKADLEPVKILNRVDLPTFGLPTMATTDDMTYQKFRVKN